jgi:hypothetical protein
MLENVIQRYHHPGQRRLTDYLELMPKEYCYLVIMVAVQKLFAERYQILYKGLQRRQIHQTSFLTLKTSQKLARRGKI